MELSDLEFKAEELFKLGFGPLGKSGKIAEDLNRILREKLAKAPEIEVIDANIKHEEMHDLIFSDYRARLVCIEKIEGDNGPFEPNSDPSVCGGRE